MPWGRTGAADHRNLEDSKGQQKTTNVEVSNCLAAIHLGRETPGARFHTAEVTGSIPVTPTSTNAFLGPSCDACCQQIASKPPTVVAVALKALPRFGVLRISMPAGENDPTSAVVRWDSRPLPPCSSGRGLGHEGAMTCSFGLPLVTARARRHHGVTDVARTQRGPARPHPCQGSPRRPVSAGSHLRPGRIRVSVMPCAPGR